MAARSARRTALCLAMLIGLAAPLAGPGAAASAASASAADTAPAAAVDPMIGTGDGGGQVGAVDTYPGPDAPFGMIQWGPDTGPTSQPVGYYHANTTLTGFSLTRLSGVGCNIFQDVRVLPTTEPVATSPGTTAGWNSYTASFSHDNETAQTGYYAVTADNGVRTELTSTTRAALGRFTFPAAGSRTMLINASSSYGNQGSSLSVVSDDTIEGSATGGGFCGHATQRYTVYFTLTFDQPFASYGTWTGGTTAPGAGTVSGTGVGGWVSFDPSASATIGARVAISYVDTSGAEANLASVHGDFDTVRARTWQAWNSLLGRIDVSGGSAAERTTFYTALYHALLDPGIDSDADGRYRGFDFAVHRVAAGHAEYTNFSGWDIYRAEVPLLALLVPGRASDMMQSLVNDAMSGGWLPKWPTATTYTGMMGGDAADPMIAGAYAFGARDFDVDTALTYMVKGADDTTSPQGQGVYAPRTGYIDQPAWGDYLAEGYVPSGSDSSAFGTALTEEFALSDFSIGQFAAAIGAHDTATAFAGRGQNWQNVFDPGSGWMAPRGPQAPATGDPATQQAGFEEGNAAQYTWMVPQNLAGLFAAMGGREAATSQLDTFFTQLNAGDSLPYEWMGNEVTLGAPWEYDYLGQPWKTQATVRDVITQLYGATPAGEPGNDDLGAMSSWYVWAALGLYPETPGTSTLALGSPLFPQAVVHMGNGHTLTIDAPAAAPDAPYVHRLSLNGHDSQRTFLTAADYRDGARLDYALSTVPDTSWGTAANDAPPSYAQGEASAIGYTTPRAAVTATRGTTTTVTVAARSVVDHPQHLRWSASVGDGIQLSPASGSLTLDAGGKAATTMSISGIGSSLPAGSYPVHITYTDTAGRTVSTADLMIDVPPLLTLTAGTPDLDLAAGSADQASFTLTSSLSGGPVGVRLSGQAPPGVTAGLDRQSAQVPAGGSVTVTATLTNPAIATGTGRYTLTAADINADDDVSVSAGCALHYTTDLARNAYGTRYPAASASSSQDGYPPSLATDGDTGTDWVSGSPPTLATPAALTDDFGTPVTVGSVTMTPRPGYGPTDYTIQTSTDGQTWATVATVTDTPVNDPVTTTLPATTARYLRLSMTGTHQPSGATVQIAELAVTAPPLPVAVAAAQADLNLAAGGTNRATFTVTNNQAAAADVTFTAATPAGVTAAVSPASASVPAGGSVTVTATLSGGTATSGAGAFALSASDSAGHTGTGYSSLHYTADLALNTYGTPYPTASATSNQGPYPPSLATDGNPATYYVSGGPSPTAATPIDLTTDFGAAVTVGSVILTPRPGYGPTDYTIQTSTDGQTWATVATVTDTPVNDPVTTTLPATTARYLRLSMTGSHQFNGSTVQIAELTAAAP